MLSGTKMAAVASVGTGANKNLSKLKTNFVTVHLCGMLLRVISYGFGITVGTQGCRSRGYFGC